MKQLKKQWNKVRVLFLTFGIVFGLFGAMPVQAQDENASGSTIFDVKIVHTNDIHARVEEDDYNQVIGMDRLSGIAQTFTEGADGSLMLDSGDTFHGQPIATLVKGESVAKLMKACGYDAMTTGNHDWSYGKERLKELGGIANVKILSGNIKNADGTSFFDTDELVKEITKNGKTLKIGVFGVSDPEMKNKTTPSNVEGLDFQDAVAYAKREAATLKAEGCDVVIALSHTLDPKNVAAQVDGVDLWLCGHEHIELSESVTTPDGSKTYVSESGHYLNSVGLIDLTCTMDEDGSVHVDYEKTSVDYEAARKGEYMLLDKTVGDYVKSTIFQLPSKMGKGVLVTPTVHGNLLVGPTAVNVEDKGAVNTTMDGLDQIARVSSHSVKNVPLRQVITSFAGIRAHEDGDD